MTNANHKRNISIKQQATFHLPSRRKWKVVFSGRVGRAGRAMEEARSFICIARNERRSVGKRSKCCFWRCGPFDRLLQMEEADLTAGVGIPQAKAKTIRSELSCVRISPRAKKAYAKYGGRLCDRLRAKNPHLLRHSSATSLGIIFIREIYRLLGRKQHRDRRHAHSDAIRTQGCRMLARSLERSLCVVSGLARGIDTCAHVGALEGNGGTIAVLGTGPERIYPPENGHLFQQIAERGLIVTEYPLGTAVSPGLFAPAQPDHRCAIARHSRRGGSAQERVAHHRRSRLGRIARRICRTRTDHIGKKSRDFGSDSTRRENRHRRWRTSFPSMKGGLKQARRLRRNGGELRGPQHFSG